jgi:hypothetical protein
MIAKIAVSVATDRKCPTASLTRNEFLRELLVNEPAIARGARLSWFKSVSVSASKKPQLSLRHFTWRIVAVEVWNYTAIFASTAEKRFSSTSAKTENASA